MGSIGAPELIIILIVVLLLFGASRLPRLARSMGEASREFKKGLSDKDAEEKPAAVDPNQPVTMTRAELDAMLAERERQTREDTPPPTA